VGVADQDGVVAAGEGAVQRRADAGVGLGTGDHEPSDVARGQLRLQVGVLERVAVALMDQRLRVAALQLVDVLPLVAALGELLVGRVLHPDHGHVLGARLVDQRGDVVDDLVAPKGAVDDAALHVDDQ